MREPKKCVHCHGRGRTVIQSEDPNTESALGPDCPHCNGTGKVVALDEGDPAPDPIPPPPDGPGGQTGQGNQ